VVDDLVDFPYHLGPAPAGDSWAFLLTNDEWMLVGLPLPHFAPVSIGIQAEVTDGDLAFLFIEGEAFQRKQRTDHIFAHSLSLFSGLGPDLAVD